MSDDDLASPFIDFCVPSRSIHSTEKVISAKHLASTGHAQNRVSLDFKCSNTVELPNFVHAGDDDLDYPLVHVDRSDMPSTREPSPEPPVRKAEECVAGEIQSYGRHFPSESSVEPQWWAPQMQHKKPIVLIVPKPMFVPYAMIEQNECVATPFPIETKLTSSAAHMQSSTPPLGQGPSLPQTNPLPSCSMLPVSAPELKRKSPLTQDKQTAAGHTKQIDNAVSSKRRQDVGLFDNLSTDKKEALCKYIYVLMVEKKFTGPEGYLLVDVFSEVMKELGHEGRCGGGEMRRGAEQRFSDLLTSAPTYFKIFRKSIKVANKCGWFGRKGQRMVSLVQNTDQ